MEIQSKRLVTLRLLLPMLRVLRGEGKGQWTFPIAVAEKHPPPRLPFAKSKRPPIRTRRAKTLQIRHNEPRLEHPQRRSVCHFYMIYISETIFFVTSTQCNSKSNPYNNPSHPIILMVVMVVIACIICFF